MTHTLTSTPPRRVLGAGRGRSVTLGQDSPLTILMGWLLNLETPVLWCCGEGSGATGKRPRPRNYDSTSSTGAHQHVTRKPASHFLRVGVALPLRRQYIRGGVLTSKRPESYTEVTATSIVRLKAITLEAGGGRTSLIRLDLPSPSLGHS